MEDMLGQILSDLNSLKEAVVAINDRLKRLECGGQALVEIDSNFEESSSVENKITDTSASGSLDYIWRKVLDIIKKELTEVSFKTWLKIIVPISMEKNIIRLGIPGEFEKGILECRYTSLIKTALKSITKIDFEIELSVLREEKKAVSNKETAVETFKIRSSLNPKNSFDSLVVGEHNSLAYKYIFEIAKNPYNHHKLLYIYGEMGMGKTHLMQAAGNYISEHYPAAKIVYISIEAFTGVMIDAIRHDNPIGFRERMLDYDVLLIDDLQFITGKEFTQAEFFKIVSELLEKGKQVVIACTRPPQDMIIMNERFTSMFELGGAFEIRRPDLDTRIEILRRRLAEGNIKLSDAELSTIAEKTSDNVRELLNAYNRYVTCAKMTGEDQAHPLKGFE